MLDPYFKRRFPLKHMKKLVYWTLEESRNLNQANAVCMTSEEEVRTAGEGFPFCNFKRVQVPYGSPGPVGDPEAQRAAFLRAWPELAGKQFLLFLGRIHPKKGCDLLLEAFARVAEPEMHLVMAGPNEVGWATELRVRAERLGIADRITWTGMLRGDEKWGAFYAAEAFILPSHQENFGIAVADAMACGLVPLVSDKVNIAAEVASDGAGLMETDTVDGTERLIARFQAMSAEERREMRVTAKACYQRRYSLRGSSETVMRALGLA
uniref:Glycosyl transferase, group 1 n=1 Tax=mine drainage metagenome TaxID=410659 RepID=E6PX72_9ZZZZ